MFLVTKAKGGLHTVCKKVGGIAMSQLTGRRTICRPPAPASLGTLQKRTHHYTLHTVFKLQCMTAKF